MTVSDTSAYDVVVVGGGPGGYVAAIRAAQLGLRTAVVEAEALGGICVNWGCIPSKALLRSAEILDLFARAGEYGVAAERITADYGAALARARKIAATQNRGVQYLLRKNNVEVVRGRGYLAARDRVAVTGGADGDRELAARNVILATGSRVRPLPGVAVDGQGVVTAREVWNLDTLPRRVVIIGGGPIGVEFATVYAAFGCEVTLVEYLPRLLPLEDEDLGTALGRSFARRGITVLTGTRVDGANATGDAVSVRLTAVEGGGTRAIAVDRVLLAAGFLPNSDSLGLEALGVATDRGY